MINGICPYGNCSALDRIPEYLADRSFGDLSGRQGLLHGLSASHD